MAIISNPVDGTLLLLDPIDLYIRRKVETLSAFGLAFDVALRQVYLAHTFANKISIVDAADGRIVETFDPNVGSPAALAFDDLRRLLYFLDFRTGDVSKKLCRFWRGL